MRGKECQAPFHVDNCACSNCRRQSCDGCHNTNVDHFTAKSVGKALGWSKKQIDSPENKQYLSYDCHRWKDQNTAHYKQVAKKLSQGKEVRFGDEIYKVPKP
jgi:hypothetical protein